MTTQWNPAHAGDTGPDRNRAEGGERESAPAGRGSDERGAAARGSAASPWNDGPAPASPDPDRSVRAEESAPYQSGPWRGYTMPVPEHPEHAEERERAAEENSVYDPPAYDGITGYPDPSGAGAAQGASQRAVPAEGGDESGAGADDGAGHTDSRPESAESAGARQRRFGRHARSSAQVAEETEANGTAQRRRQGDADHDDDPDGLAGWVGSLTEAADDTRIAGRHTGSFPVVTPETERPEDQGERSRGEGGRDDSTRGGRDRAEGGQGERGRSRRDRVDSDRDGHDQDERERDEPDQPDAQEGTRERHTSRPAPGVARPATATWVPGPEEDEGVTDGAEERGEPDGAATPGTADAGFDLLDDEGAARAAAASEAPAKPTGDESADVPEGEEAADDGPEPLPRRVPGPSAVSGAFRAIGADTVVPEPVSGSASRAEGTAPEEDDEEYRPTSGDHWQPTSTTSRAELIERLDALSTLTELGQGDLPEKVLGQAGQLLDHAGARLRLSGDHTVVALAGGTGSGKSSLFNALCGLELSQTGVTRPTTSKAHACVWGHEGADALLSWLGVPTRYRHSRTGVLDTNNSELTGLVLLDLPDHDSVRSMHTAEADRLIGSVDLLVWVLDPQKYADAAVHHRYLAKMAGHGAVTVAVLNQVDRVAPDELEELLTDLRRLLETESGVHPRVITTSTVTGQGIREVREFLGETVVERRALVDRLVADLDQVIVPFEEFYGEGEVPATVSAEVRSQVHEGLAKAAGVTAVADVVETNDVRRGKRRVGWPVARRAAKLRKDPLAAVQLDFLRRDEPGVGGPVDAHEAELETALGEAADQVSKGMPGPWRRRMRAAARSGVSELPTELGEAVAGAVGDPDRSPSWWRMARTLQYVLLAVAGAGFAWAVVSLLSWLGGGITGLRMFDAPVFVAYAGAVLVAGLLVGWLTGVGCGNLVEVAAVQRREEVERTAQTRVREIAGRRVVAPMEEELARYRAFRAAYEVARIQD
ncbi:GTPase [Nocardiopsis sp. L17-MgMaSL7]|uniref:GTPase n=1 Tax=Nocardiopsis sp. L17-MgMaSL7 TaxID=1938893 RepID=UPI000D71C6F1|nr:GTPase [Nocardiopsis sp. L17-MgMaSL7]PWV57587.1 50S ribosome-binding GTPase [Nocardiopsis sp. L17-MgMaSL7]